MAQKSQSQPEVRKPASPERAKTKVKKYKPGPRFTQIKGAKPNRESDPESAQKPKVDARLSAALAQPTLTSQADAEPEVGVSETQSQASTQSSVTSSQKEVTKAKKTGKRRSVAGPLAGVQNMAALRKAMAGSSQKVSPSYYFTSLSLNNALK